MPDSGKSDVSRRKYLTLAGSAAAAAVAGCTGGDETPTEGSGSPEGSDSGTSSPTQEGTPTDRPEPTTRKGYLQRANRHCHDESPWVYLHRQYSVYGQSKDINWKPRRDERVDAYAIEPATDSGDHAVMTQNQMDSGLDPQDHRETPTDNIVLQCYEGLLERDRTGKIMQVLATDYKRLDDTTIQFKVRDNVSFHSGDSLTPEDVAYSINRIVKEDVGIASPQVDQLIGVEGAEVASESDRTVNVNLSGLNPIVFQTFATYCDVMNKSWVEDHEKAYINQHMEGTGPFKLANYEQGVKVEYTRNNDYWQDQAPLSTFTINSAKESSTRVNKLLGGESDLITSVPPQDVSRVNSNDGTKVSAVPSTRIIFNAMRYDVEPFDSPKFRRAINYAIDNEAIIKNVLKTFGDATTQPTLEGFFGFNGDLKNYPQDKEKAEALVEESGYAGAEIELVTPNGRYLKDVATAQAVAAQVDALSNVSASSKTVEFSTLVSQVTTGKIEDKPHWYLLGWGNATFDAIQTIQPLLASDGSLTSYKNDELDRLLDEAQSLPSESS